MPLLSVIRCRVNVAPLHASWLDPVSAMVRVPPLAYVALYVFGLIQAVSALLRTHRRGLEAALPMVAVVGGLALVPITMTNDLWGDFSVTFLFWWAVGSCASAAFGYVPARDVAPAARTSIASS